MLLSELSVDVAFSVMKRLGNEYPQALFYPLLISANMSSYEELRVSQTSKCRNIQQTLFASVQNPVLSKFVLELENLQTPLTKFTEWMGMIMRHISSVRASSNNSKMELPESVQRSLQNELRSRFLFEDSFPQDASSVGLLWRDFIQVWRPVILQTLSSGFTATNVQQMRSLLSGTSAQATDAVKSFFEKRSKGAKPQLLVELSSWLANYKPSESSAEIEIPGQYAQYDGTQRPVVALHSALVSCSPSILTMASLREPRRISFVAQDERHHRFLVKSGEDMRTDQRVEQAFSISNRLVSSSLGASAGDLSIPVYSVTPMSLFVGLVEWVGETSSLKALVERTANARLQATQDGRTSPSAAAWMLHKNEAGDKRKEWLSGYCLGPQESQATIFKRVLGDSVAASETGLPGAVRVWSRMMACLPIDLLRTQLNLLSSSPEGLLMVRSRFIQSLAMFNAVGYVLGIGDRHLDNFLLDTKTGSMVPIDFGAIFGLGTAELPIPELIPCRLTPQLMCVASPVMVTSRIRKGMTKTMTILSSEEGTRRLMTALAVFANDPSLDWKATIQARTASKAKDLTSESSRASMEDWFPKAKLLVAKMKLTRVNPVVPVFIDLLQNRSILGAHAKPLSSHRKDLPDITSEVLSVSVKQVLYGTYGGAQRFRAQKDNLLPRGLTLNERTLLEHVTGREFTIDNAANSSAVASKKPFSFPMYDAPTTDAQVACIIDMATDPNLMMRQFDGLALWI
jgi:DNA-dependent protein kinase catalytic subunit